MRFIFSIVICLVLLFSFPLSVLAVYDPLSVPNNPFGIHIIDPHDLEDAASLVNTEGDWGYVTFVIRQDQRNTKQWQEVFDKARRLHLIPIVRVATRQLEDAWEKPSFGDIDGWVSFFNSLNWVVKNRYVVIGNEPNHAKEWGGEINPEEYAQYLEEFSTKLKASSNDYFILPAGLDASASNSRETMDEAVFLSTMLAEKPEVFTNIDGWASHSYPNPAFSGPENGFGRGSVRTYEWELAFLKALGIAKELPVFITETGWEHNGNVETLGNKFSYAFNNVWSDKRVIAVTPFILSYLEPPFESFSWKKKEGGFFSFYTDIQKLPKTKGKPVQEDKGEILAVFVSPIHLIGSTFTGIALVRNDGQAIWSPEEVGVSINGETVAAQSSFTLLEPKSLSLITFSGQSPQESGPRIQAVTLNRLGKTISEPSFFQLLTISPLRMKTDDFFGKIVRFLGL